MEKIQQAVRLLGGIAFAILGIGMMIAALTGSQAYAQEPLKGDRVIHTAEDAKNLARGTNVTMILEVAGTGWPCYGTVEQCEQLRKKLAMFTTK